VTRAVLVTWVALWVAGFLSALAGGPGISLRLALDAPAILHGDLGALFTVLSYAWVHDPNGILHLLINGLMFYWWAPEVETLWRRGRMVTFLLLATLAGAGVNLLLTWLLPGSFNSRVLGGSGLVSAVLAAHAAIYPGRILNLLVLRCRLISFFLVLCALDLLWLIADMAGRIDGVAQEVHLAGALTGWIWAGGFWRHGIKPGFGGGMARRWQNWRTARRQRQEAGEEAELDRILAKIGREGLNALNAEERAFLERRSKRRKR
jgi:membrane associated rhomboid family serine protease